MTLKIRKRYSEKSTVTLFPGDCLALLQKIPAGAAQLVLTSPPYNVGKSYELSQTLEQYLQAQRQVIAQCIRITAEGGSICWQVGHHVNGCCQVIPLDIILHPLFAEHVLSIVIRLSNMLVWHF